MGLFSNLFSSKPKTVVTTPLGPFTLTNIKKNIYIWRNGKMSVRGTETQPDEQQLKFLETAEAQLHQLSDKITARFIQEYKDADLTPEFTEWKEQFKVIGYDVVRIENNDVYWDITFEDLQPPLTHFILHVEAGKLADFSFDI